MDKQLANVNAEEALARKNADKALTLKQLAVVAGLGYSVARSLAREPGFPLLGEVVFYSDFIEWRRTRSATKEAPRG